MSLHKGTVALNKFYTKKETILICYNAMLRP